MISYILAYLAGVASGAAGYHYRAAIVASVYPRLVALGQRIGLIKDS